MTKKGGKPADAWFDQHLKKHAFRGELGFPLTFELLGERFTKMAKIVYAYTPGDWRWFNPTTRTTRKGVESAVYHIDLRLVPEEWHDDGADHGAVKDGELYWFTFGDFIRDDMLPNDVLSAIINAVDEKCRAEDDERRGAAGL